MPAESRIPLHIRATAGPTDVSEERNQPQSRGGLLENGLQLGEDGVENPLLVRIMDEFGTRLAEVDHEHERRLGAALIREIRVAQMLEHELDHAESDEPAHENRRNEAQVLEESEELVLDDALVVDEVQVSEQSQRDVELGAEELFDREAVGRLERGQIRQKLIEQVAKRLFIDQVEQKHARNLEKGAEEFFFGQRRQAILVEDDRVGRYEWLAQSQIGADTRQEPF